MKKGIYVNDSIHGLILLSEYEKRIISSVGFNRLHDVYQNSTVYLTFPTNRTKRFEHSIGTMKLCSDMFFASVLNATPENLNHFYEIFQIEYSRLIIELAKEHMFCEQKLGGMTPNTMPQIEYDKFRHSLIPHNVPDKYKIVHSILIQSVRVAALLHDIGHPPFSHVVENALRTVYNECRISYDKEEKRSDRVTIFLDTMSQYFDGGKKLHEQMGDEISDSILNGVIPNIENDENDEYDENLFETLVLKSVKRIFDETAPFSYLHRIIDSSLDGDRLDYVTRDPLNSGLDSGKIDYRRIIDEMQLVVDCNEIFFCVPLKAINSVEDFVKRRYNIYKDIIYHHRVIKTDYLLEYSVKDLINKYLGGSTEEESHNRTLIPYDVSGLWFPLGEATTSEKSNALSQWNDSWLMTILKQIYYTEYYRNREIKQGTGEYVLKQRLSELLCNNKCYYSMIKRSENFRLIDDNVKAVLAENAKEIEGLVKEINVLSNKLSKSEALKESSGETMLDIKGTLDFIAETLGCSTSSSKGFMLSFASRRYKAIRMDSFENFVEEIAEEETRKTFTNTRLYDTIVVFKNISIGLDKQPIYFYDYNRKICTLDAISGISNILRLDSDYLPVFYIYILIKDGEAIVHEKRDVLLKNMGKAIGEKLKDKIVEVLMLVIEQMEGLVCVK